MNSMYLDVTRIQELVQVDSIAFLLSLALGAWIGYKTLLRRVSIERHRIFQEHFSNLAVHIGIGLGLFAAYQSMLVSFGSVDWIAKLLNTIGLLCIFWGCIILVKIMRIVAYEYLFLRSMKVGVPLLVVNILTLLMYLFAFGWILKAVFKMDLTPILATSAVLSIVLGLALQDTIGNLFAGISLQIDKPYSIGDWIEVKTGTDKIVGKVEEISWRATLMRAMSDEVITLPNRMMAQAQISNFAARELPFLRVLLLKLPHDVKIETAKATMLSAISGIDGVLKFPEPICLIGEVAESWISVKLIYYISDYGGQFIIADKCFDAVVSALRAKKIHLGKNEILVLKEAAAEV